MSFLLPTTKISTSQGKQSELGITSSEYEKDIPFGYGVDRIGGNIIWASNIVEEKVVTTQKQGGKGSPKTKTTTSTYLYYVDLAVLICEGEIDAITRVWGDGKVILDNLTGESIDDLVMRVYTGSETQLPDALIELDVGAGNTPAYRGLCYVVFERLPLSNFGNRIPAFTFEVAFDGSLSSEIEVDSISADFTNNIYSGDGGGTYTATVVNRQDSARWNFETNELYLEATDNGAGAAAGVRVDPNTQTIVAGIPSRTQPINDGANAVNGVHEPSSDYMVRQSQSVGAFRDDLFWRNEITADTVAEARSTRQLDEDAMCMDVGGVPIMVGTYVGSGAFTQLGYAAVNMSTATVVGEIALPGGFSCLGVQLGRTTANLVGSGVFAETYGIFMSSTSMRIVQMVAENAGDVTMAVVETLSPSNIAAGGTSWNTNPYFAVNRITGEVYVQIEVNSVPYVFCWSPNTSSIEWITQVPHVLYGGVFLDGGTGGATNLIGNNWVWVDDQQRVIRLLLASGAIDTNFDGTVVNTDIVEGNLGGGSASTKFHWNDATSTLIGVVDGDLDDAPKGVYFHQFSFTLDTDISPRAIIVDVCERAGLTSAEIDVSEVPTSQAGLRSMVVRERTNAADALAPLLDLLEIEVVETDFQLKFFPRGSGSSVATISEAEMVPTQDNQNEPYARAFIREEELPRRFEVVYDDFNTDYQPSVGADERSEVTQFSQSVEGFQYNGSCTADLPRQSAQVKLYSAWAERERLRQRLPQKYLFLDAGDVITTQLDNGDEIIGRLRKADMGANFNVDVEQVAETTGVYTSDLAGAISDSHFVSTIPNTGDSLTIIIDSPLIRDEDSDGASNSVLYWVANGPATWPGVVLYKETGSSTVQEVGQQVIGVPYGVLVTAPPDIEGEINRFVDQTFRVEMALGADEFESVTDDDVLAGRNLLAVVHDDGSLELLQFATVTVIGPTTLDLSRLLRGRRGTNTMAVDHEIGNRVFLVDAAWADLFSQPVSTLNSAQTFRGVTIGQLFEDANAQEKTSIGRDLMPYSPVHFSAVDDGSGGLNISFTRRTRIGGEDDWLLSGDVPLSEAAESYEIDILDAPGGSVLRTLTGSTETINYSSANITSDFGSLPATLDIEAYQISAVVGRGFPAIVTLET